MASPDRDKACPPDAEAAFRAISPHAEGVNSGAGARGGGGYAEATDSSGSRHGMRDVGSGLPATRPSARPPQADNPSGEVRHNMPAFMRTVGFQDPDPRQDGPRDARRSPCAVDELRLTRIHDVVNTTHTSFEEPPSLVSEASLSLSVDTLGLPLSPSPRFDTSYVPGPPVDVPSPASSHDSPERIGRRRPYILNRVLEGHTPLIHHVVDPLPRSRDGTPVRYRPEEEEEAAANDISELNNIFLDYEERIAHLKQQLAAEMEEREAVAAEKSRLQQRLEELGDQVGRQRDAALQSERERERWRVANRDCADATSLHSIVADELRDRCVALEAENAELRRHADSAAHQWAHQWEEERQRARAALHDAASARLLVAQLQEEVERERQGRGRERGDLQGTIRAGEQKLTTALSELEAQRAAVQRLEKACRDMERRQEESVADMSVLRRDNAKASAREQERMAQGGGGKGDERGGQATHAAMKTHASASEAQKVGLAQPSSGPWGEGRQASPLPQPAVPQPPEQPQDLQADGLIVRALCEGGNEERERGRREALRLVQKQRDRLLRLMMCMWHCAARRRVRSGEVLGRVLDRQRRRQEAAALRRVREFGYARWLHTYEDRYEAQATCNAQLEATLHSLTEERDGLVRRLAALGAARGHSSLHASQEGEGEEGEGEEVLCKQLGGKGGEGGGLRRQNAALRRELEALRGQVQKLGQVNEGMCERTVRQLASTRQRRTLSSTLRAWVASVRDERVRDPCGVPEGGSKGGPQEMMRQAMQCWMDTIKASRRRRKVVAQMARRIERESEKQERAMLSVVLAAWASMAKQGRRRHRAVRSFSIRSERSVLSNAFSAWAALTGTQTRMHGLLGRLLSGYRRRLLTGAMRAWRQHLYRQRHMVAGEQLAMTLDTLRHQSQTIDTLNGQVAGLQAERETLLARQLVLESSMGELRLQHQARAEGTMRRAITMYRNHALMTTLQAWMTYTREQRRQRRLMRLCLARMRQGTVQRCFNAWAGYVPAAQRERQALARFEARRRKTHLQQLWCDWVGFAKQEQRHRVLLDRCARRLQHLQAARSLDSWMQFTRLCRVMRSVVHKMSHRLRHDHLLEAFNSWQDRVQEAREIEATEEAELEQTRQQQERGELQRRRAARMIAHWQHATQASAWNAWVQWTRDSKRLRVGLERVARRWRGMMTARSLEAWREYVQTRKWLRGLLGRMLGGKRLQALSSGLRVWRDHVRDTHAEEQGERVAELSTLVAQLQSERETLLARQQVLENSMGELRLQHQARAEGTMRRVIAMYRQRALMTTLQAWMTYTREQRRQRRLIKLYLVRMRQGTVQRCFNAWAGHVPAAQRERQLLSRFEARRRKTHLQQLWCDWVGFTAEKTHRRDLLDRCARRLQHLQAARCLDSWMQFTRLCRVMRSVVHKMSHRLRHDHLLEAFNSWQDRVQEAREMEAAEEAELEQTRQQQERGELQRRRAARMIAHWQHATQTSAWNAWVQSTRDSKRLRVGLERVARRWRGMMTARSLEAWREYVQTRKWLRGLLGRMLGGKRLQALPSGLRVWRDHVRDTHAEEQGERVAELSTLVAQLQSERETLLARQQVLESSMGELRLQHQARAEGTMRRVIAMYRQRALMTTLQAWMTYTREQRRQRRLIKLYLVRMRQGTVQRCFNAWAGHVPAAQRERQLLSRFEARRRKTHLQQLWCDWVGFTAKKTHRRDLLDRCARRLQHLQAARSLDSWMQFTRLRRVMRSVVHKMSHRLRHDHLLEAFNSWQDRVQEAREMEAAEEAELEQTRQQQERGELQRRRAARMIAHWQHATQASAWNAWVQSTRDSKRLRVGLERVARRWRGMMTARSLEAWREYVQTRKWLRGLLGRMLGGKRLQALSSGLRGWRDHVNAARIDSGELALAQQIEMVRGLTEEGKQLKEQLRILQDQQQDHAEKRRALLVLEESNHQLSSTVTGMKLEMEALQSRRLFLESELAALADRHVAVTEAQQNTSQAVVLKTCMGQWRQLAQQGRLQKRVIAVANRGEALRILTRVLGAWRLSVSRSKAQKSALLLSELTAEKELHEHEKENSSRLQASLEADLERLKATKAQRGMRTALRLISLNQQSTTHRALLGWQVNILKERVVDAQTHADELQARCDGLQERVGAMVPHEEQASLQEENRRLSQTVLELGADLSTLENEGRAQQLAQVCTWKQDTVTRFIERFEKASQARLLESCWRAWLCYQRLAAMRAHRLELFAARRRREALQSMWYTWRSQHLETQGREHADRARSLQVELADRTSLLSQCVQQVTQQKLLHQEAQARWQTLRDAHLLRVSQWSARSSKVLVWEHWCRFNAMGQRRRRLLVVYQRERMATIAHALQVWRLRTKEARLQHMVSRRMGDESQRHAMARLLGTWKETIRQQQCFRRIVRRRAPDTVTRLLVRQWRTWLLVVTHSRLQELMRAAGDDQEKVLRLSTELREMTQLNVGLTEDMTALRQLLASVHDAKREYALRTLRRVTGVLQHRSLQRAMAAWTAHTKTARHRLLHVSRFEARWRRTHLQQLWREWVAFAKEEQRRRVLLDRCARRLRYIQAARCLDSWVQYTKGRHAMRSVLHTMQHRIRHDHLLEAFNSWQDRAQEVREIEAAEEAELEQTRQQQERGELQRRRAARMIAHWRHATQASAWNAWVQWLRGRQHLRKLTLERVARRWRGMMTARSLEAWREYVQTRKWLRGLLGRLLGGKRLQALSSGLRVWRDHVKDTHAEEQGERMAELSTLVMQLQSERETLLARQQVLENSMGELRLQHQARAEGTMRRAITMFRNHALMTTLQAWMAYTREQRRQRRLVSRHLAVWQRGRLMRVWRAWAGEAKDGKRRQVVLNRCAQRLRHLQAARCLDAWMEYTSKRRLQRAVICKMLSAQKREGVRKYLRRWEEVAHNMRDHEAALEEGFKDEETRVKDQLLEEQSTMINSLREEQEALEDKLFQSTHLYEHQLRAVRALRQRWTRMMVGKWTQALAAHAFKAWIHYVRLARKVRAATMRFAARSSRALVSHTFQQWASKCWRDRGYVQRVQLEERQLAQGKPSTRLVDLEVEKIALQARVEELEEKRQAPAAQEESVDPGLWQDEERRYGAHQFAGVILQEKPGFDMTVRASEVGLTDIVKTQTAYLNDISSTVQKLKQKLEGKQAEHQRDLRALRLVYTIAGAHSSRLQKQVAFERLQFRTIAAHWRTAGLQSLETGMRELMNDFANLTKREELYSALQRGMRHLNQYTGLLYLCDEGQDSLLVAAPPLFKDEKRLPVWAGVVGCVARSGQAMCCRPARHARFSPQVDGILFSSATVSEADWAILIPVQDAAGETRGVLMLCKGCSGTFRDTDGSRQGPPSVGLMEAAYISAMVSQVAATACALSRKVDRQLTAMEGPSGAGYAHDRGRSAFVEYGDLATRVTESTSAFLSSTLRKEEGRGRFERGADSPATAGERASRREAQSRRPVDYSPEAIMQHHLNALYRQDR